MQTEITSPCGICQPTFRIAQSGFVTCEIWIYFVSMLFQVNRNLFKNVSGKVLVQKTGLIYIIAYKDMHVCVYLCIISLYKSYLSTSVELLAHNTEPHVLICSGGFGFSHAKTWFEWLLFFQTCLTLCRQLPSAAFVSSLWHTLAITFELIS